MGPLDALAGCLSFVLSRLVASTGSPGISLVLLAVALQGLLYVPIHYGVRTREVLVVVQAELDELKKRYEKEPARLQAEVLQVYKRYGVNPLGGCLPTLLWLAVVVAMWRVFGLEAELWRGAQFLWMAPGEPHNSFPAFFASNLAGFDGALFALFGVLCGLAYLKSRSPDARTVMFVFIMGLVDQWPAGLVLYWGPFALCQIALHPSVDVAKVVGANLGESSESGR